MYYARAMTKNPYTELPAEVIAHIEAGECTTEQAANALSFALIVSGFVGWASTQPLYRSMFENNDEAHFTEYLEHSMQFKREFAQYLAAVAG